MKCENKFCQQHNPYMTKGCDLTTDIEDCFFKKEYDKSNQVQAGVKPACFDWQKEKPNKPCYFIHRYNRKDNKPSLFEAVIDGGVLVVANIQDDEFVETMEDFSDGDFFIIEKY